jgi:hypothetical protein
MYDRPYFSIATATRNALEQLKRCVGSVRGQKGVSYEHVVQDAISSDGTPQGLSAQADLAAVPKTHIGRASPGKADDRRLPTTFDYISIRR